jgi:hypothetical protein
LAWQLSAPNTRRRALSVNQRFHCAMLRMMATKPSQIEHAIGAGRSAVTHIGENHPARFRDDETVDGGERVVQADQAIFQ